MAYRCEAVSVGGFVQQLAVSYLRNGYWFYVAGRVPEGKDPAAVDRKLIERYGIDLSKWARARRKRLGMANLQYLRFRGFFLLLATHGEHQFFTEERAVIRDVRRQPITFAGYAVTHRGGRSHVRIERTEFRMLERPSARARGTSLRGDARAGIPAAALRAVCPGPASAPGTPACRERPPEGGRVRAGADHLHPPPAGESTGRSSDRRMTSPRPGSVRATPRPGDDRDGRPSDDDELGMK